MFYGLSDLPWWGNLVVLMVFTQITIACVTVFLHRHQAHRALTLHPIMSHFFRFWLWLTTGMVTKEWAAIHRKHHAKCETPDDPHSPQVMGLRTVLWQGAELYRKEAKNAETMTRYGQGTPDDWMEHHVYSHSKWGISIMLTIDVLLFGVPGLAIWALQMAWIPFFAAGIVNGVGHFWGYRNFECPDEARNVCPLGVFIGGEELHNNHHTYPTSAKLSVKPWEFDIGWGYIRIMEMLGLAKAKRVAPKPELVPGKDEVDLATLKGIVVNRFQVMARFAKQVIEPVFHQHAPTANDLPIKALMIRDQSLLDEGTKQNLAGFLAHHNALQVVYQFKERLQALWMTTTVKECELLEALQKWCQEAETTGIAALNEFSSYLRTFTLKPA